MHHALFFLIMSESRRSRSKILRVILSLSRLFVLMSLRIVSF